MPSRRTDPSLSPIANEILRSGIFSSSPTVDTNDGRMRRRVQMLMDQVHLDRRTPQRLEQLKATLASGVVVDVELFQQTNDISPEVWSILLSMLIQQQARTKGGTKIVQAVDILTGRETLRPAAAPRQPKDILAHTTSQELLDYLYDRAEGLDPIRDEDKAALFAIMNTLDAWRDARMTDRITDVLRLMDVDRLSPRMLFAFEYSTRGDGFTAAKARMVFTERMEASVDRRLGTGFTQGFLNRPR